MYTPPKVIDLSLFLLTISRMGDIIVTESDEYITPRRKKNKHPDPNTKKENSNTQDHTLSYSYRGSSDNSRGTYLRRLV